jgi:hypothetical protein
LVHRRIFPLNEISSTLNSEYANFRQEMTSPDSRSNHGYETHSVVKENENSAALGIGIAKTGTSLALAAGTTPTAVDKDATAAGSTAAAATIARLAAGKSQAVDEVDGKVTQLLGKEYQMKTKKFLIKIPHVQAFMLSFYRKVLVGH